MIGNSWRRKLNRTTYITNTYIIFTTLSATTNPTSNESQTGSIVYSILNYPVYVYITPPSPSPSHNPSPFYSPDLLDNPNQSIAPYSSNTSSTRGVRFRFVGVAVDICGADDEVVVAEAAGGWPGTCSGLAVVPDVAAALLDFFLDFFFSYITR